MESLIMLFLEHLAPSRIFLDSSERLVKPGGTLLAMKGDKMEQLNNKKISVYPLWSLN